MLPIAYYLLKVIICSGILLGYYWLFLRNKIFHRYNRFYLLAAIVLSLSLPLIQINIWNKSEKPKNEVIQLLQIVSSGDNYVAHYSATPPLHENWDPTMLIKLTYLLISSLFLIVFLHVLWTIRTLLKKYNRQLVDDIYFVNTDARGTPFSFLRYIFWNDKIDIESTTGNQVFRHEVAHVQEKHSYDKLFMNIVMIVFWINPFFWLIRKELNMIHEFIADKKAVEDSDTAAFAVMILQATYPQHRFQLTNNFFYSPIKRRLLMLTKNNNPKVSYFGRVLVLPLALLVFAAFTFKAEVNSPIHNGRAITVVIDAGHGGTDLGAVSADGKISEKDLNLAITKQIKELNTNANIRIILTRENDLYQSPADKAIFCNQQNADLFISIHVDNGPKDSANTKTGMSVWVAKDAYPKSEKSKILASAIINAFSNNYGLSVMPQPMQREKGIWVLQATTCPAVLIETGFINNKKDLTYLQTDGAKETIAKNILNSIEAYAVNSVKNIETIEGLSDTNPKSYDSIPSLKKSKKEHEKEIAEIKQIAKDKEEIAYVYKGRSYFFMNSSATNFWETEINAPVLLNGKVIYAPGDINSHARRTEVFSITRIEKEEAVAKFGINKSILNIRKDGETTVNVQQQIITTATKTNVASTTDVKVNITPRIYIGEIAKSRVSAELFKNQKEIRVTPGYSFVGTDIYFSGAGFKFVETAHLRNSSLKSIENLIERCEAGTTVTFDNIYVKDAAGNLKEIEGQGYSLYDIDEKNGTDNKIFSNVQKEPKFPGTEDGWNKYLIKNLDASAPVKEGWKPGMYTVMLQYIVHTDGSISDITTTNYKGSKTAQHCIDLIKKGPKWEPALQNGKPVNAFKRQPITFVVEESK